jgi:hypothetical protein
MGNLGVDEYYCFAIWSDAGVIGGGESYIKLRTPWAGNNVDYSGKARARIAQRHIYRIHRSARRFHICYRKSFSIKLQRCYCTKRPDRESGRDLAGHGPETGLQVARAIRRDRGEEGTECQAANSGGFITLLWAFLRILGRYL